MMKRMLWKVTLLAVAVALLVGCKAQEPELRVMTFNMRYDNPDDGPNNWLYRRDRIVQLIKAEAPQVLGAQELLHHQLEYLVAQLPHYTQLGVARDDGATQGEYAPILYNQQEVTLLDGGYFWLSATPSEPSLGWDAACHRICTWGHFRTKQEGQEFCLLNTHFDHEGAEARIKSAEMIRQEVDKWAVKVPVIVTGDFNATPSSDVILNLTTSPHKGSLTDSFTSAKR